MSPRPAFSRSKLRPMTEEKVQALVFGEIATEYERVRPAIPPR